MLFDPQWTPPAEIKLEPWQEILLKAADILETQGWIQGKLGAAGGYCMMGAMQVAAYGHPISLHIRTNHDSRYIIGVQKLQQFCGEPVWGWNDRKGRTKEEVIAKLRKVAHAV